MPNCPTCHLDYPPGTKLCPLDGAALPIDAADEPGGDEARQQEARGAESRSAESVRVKLGSAPTIPERPPERSPGLAASTAVTAAQPQPQEQQFDSLIGIVLAGRYEVVRRIGEGGMGAVYESKHALIGKRGGGEVVLLEKFHAKSDFVARLLQESARPGQLHRPPEHCRRRDRLRHHRRRTSVSVVMEFLDGESLADLERREALLPIERSLRIARRCRRPARSAPRTPRGSSPRREAGEPSFSCGGADADFVKVASTSISKRGQAGATMAPRPTASRAHAPAGHAALHVARAGPRRRGPRSMRRHLGRSACCSTSASPARSLFAPTTTCRSSPRC